MLNPRLKRNSVIVTCITENILAALAALAIYVCASPTNSLMF